MSSKTTIGISELENQLCIMCAKNNENLEAAPLTRARHTDAIKNAINALNNSVQSLDLPPELIVEDLRLAARHLGSISGMVGVEDVLDKVFSSFCIGK